MPKLYCAILVLLLGALAGPAHSAQFNLKLPLGLQESAAFIPDDNPLTPEKIALGKQFFWDKRWSRNGSVACVTCHDPNHGWGDPRQFSARFDGKPTARHSPTLVNRLFGDVQQWNGQRASLEDQAIKASDQAPDAAYQKSRGCCVLPGAAPQGFWHESQSRGCRESDRGL